MNEIRSIARRLRKYAGEPGICAQKREDLLTSADALDHLNAMLNAKPARDDPPPLKPRPSG